MGRFSEQHTGFHLKCAAESLNLPHSCLDISTASSPNPWLNRLVWKLLDRTYWHQPAFQRTLIEQVEKTSATHLLVMGTSPVNAQTLLELKKRSVYTINFVTDDPWNPVHYSQWFHSSLKAYDLLLTPRKANLGELSDWAKTKVAYLPFGYNPKVHFELSQLSENERKKYECDILFFGGADSDRIPYIRRLIDQGFKVKLFGGYWDRDPMTKNVSMGIVDLEILRKAIKAAKICLNLVRRANRDGHVMRTFEIPAMGGCLLTEYTQEHHEIFGTPSVQMFTSEEDLINQAHRLLKSDDARQTNTQLGKDKILNSKNTYRDRLETILQLAS